jgi:hypothetical protein
MDSAARYWIKTILEDKEAGRVRRMEYCKQPGGDSQTFEPRPRPESWNDAVHTKGVGFIQYLAALSICDAVDEDGRLGVRIKWPNDIYAEVEGVGGTDRGSKYSPTTIRHWPPIKFVLTKIPPSFARPFFPLPTSVPPTPSTSA